MERLTENKLVLVTRPTRLAELIVRFNTVDQARFYVEHLGADFSDYLAEDRTYRHAVSTVRESLERLGRVQVLDRTLLPSFIFGPEDTVIVLGQDGLVANTVKYLSRQPVVGVNPDPARWEGKLLPFSPADLHKVIPEVFRHRRPTIDVSMAKAELNNGQSLYAVNDFFIGVRSHTSARYTIALSDREERQSSSGVIVSTGLGSSGWLRSLLTGAAAVALSSGTTGAPARTPEAGFQVPSEFPWDADYLVFTVREPYPTRTTGASLVFGRVTPDSPLRITSLMAENGVIFSDGIEKDYLEFNSGSHVRLTLAERKGVLVQ